MKYQAGESYLTHVSELTPGLQYIPTCIRFDPVSVVNRRMRHISFEASHRKWLYALLMHIPLQRIDRHGAAQEHDDLREEERVDSQIETEN